MTIDEHGGAVTGPTNAGAAGAGRSGVGYCGLSVRYAS